MTTVKELVKFTLKAEKTGIEMPQLLITQSTDTVNVLRQIHELEGNHIQEFFYVLFLSRSNKVTGYQLLSMGGMTGTVADPRLIVKAAALTNCTSIVLCHNHPSGNLRPSRADEDITQKIKTAASYLDIAVLDHIILAEGEGYYSFADEGLI